MRNEQTHKFLIFSTVLHADIRLTRLIEYFEREMFDIRLNLRIGELAANEAFCVEDTGEDGQYVDRLYRGKEHKAHVLWGFIAT